ncbi:S8 family serine peptidase [Parachitinimonas caeni]|uniref:S8 family serine peptidase n=1 Tax=Parachitinimonas caeni TaxID=3031301 RepID=A0ABT7E102_9NEIS|nr:S8 family serine peptidase [Parachitinimonas caeni]MDK2126002.1 S8 family serine peptidase [Parachitinimonas caeni]
MQLKKSTIFTRTILAASVLGLSAMATVHAEEPVVVGLIVKFKNQPNQLRATQKQDRSARVMSAGRSMGLELREKANFEVNALSKREIQVYSLNGSTTESKIRDLAKQLKEQNPSIEYAEPDLLMHALDEPDRSKPNDPFFFVQWHLKNTRTDVAWNRTNGKHVRIAAIDTGNVRNQDLIENIIPGYDFTSKNISVPAEKDSTGKIIKYKSVDNSGDGDDWDTDPTDPGDMAPEGSCGLDPVHIQSSWHGTTVSSIMAATTNNGASVAGAAYGAKVMPLRVLGKCGGATSDIIAAIYHASGVNMTWNGKPARAIPEKVRVINMSLGGRGQCGISLQTAIDDVAKLGVVSVVAAGNSGLNIDTTPYSPAGCNNVITVGASDQEDNRVIPQPASGREWGSNWGANKVAVYAPGVRVFTVWGMDSWNYHDGTSFSAPQVSAAAAMMLSQNPSLKPADIKKAIQETARVSGDIKILDTEAAVARVSSGPGYFLGKIYIEGFNRYPDDSGFDFWMNAIKGNGGCSLSKLGAVANDILTTSDFLNTNKTNATRLDAAYRALFARQPDTAGYNWWLAKLDANQISWADLVKNFVTSDEFVKLAPKYCAQ